MKFASTFQNLLCSHDHIFNRLFASWSLDTSVLTLLAQNILAHTDENNKNIASETEREIIWEVNIFFFLPKKDLFSTKKGLRGLSWQLADAIEITMPIGPGHFNEITFYCSHLLRLSA